MITETDVTEFNLDSKKYFYVFLSDYIVNGVIKMKIRKTSMAERQLSKFTKCFERKNQMFVMKSPEGQKLVAKHLARMNPQALISEQRFYKYVNPVAYEKIVKESNAKDIIKDCREKHGKSVTEMVTEFFSHQNALEMRSAQETQIGLNIPDVMDCSSRMIQNCLATDRKMAQGKKPIQ